MEAIELKRGVPSNRGGMNYYQSENMLEDYGPTMKVYSAEDVDKLVEAARKLIKATDNMYLPVLSKLISDVKIAISQFEQPGNTGELEES